VYSAIHRFFCCVYFANISLYRKLLYKVEKSLSSEMSWSGGASPSHHVIQARPELDLSSTRAQPELDPSSTRAQPELNPSST
jgi:hypothetical protein